MKILQIAPPWVECPPRSYGGTERIVSFLTEELVKQGHDVTLFATGNSKTSGKLEFLFKKSLFEMKENWKDASMPLLHYYKAFKLAENYDIVHCHLSSDTDPVMFPLIVECKTPVIMTIHGKCPFDKISDNSDRYYFDLFSNKINAVNISKSMQKEMPGNFIDKGIVYNGFQVPTFPFIKEPKGDYYAWVGRFEKEKGVKEIMLAAKKANVKLILAGILDLSLDRVEEYYKNEVEPLIDGDQIQFIGEVSSDKRNELIGNAKGFLNYLKWEEPFGMVMVESLLVGTPVIATSRGAATEIIQDGKNGYLVNSIDEMAEKIKDIDKIDRSYCRKYAENNFSIENMTNKYIEIYESVGSRKKFTEAFLKDIYPI